MDYKGLKIEELVILKVMYDSDEMITIPYILKEVGKYDVKNYLKFSPNDTFYFINKLISLENIDKVSESAKCVKYKLTESGREFALMAINNSAEILNKLKNERAQEVLDGLETMEIADLFKIVGRAKELLNNKGIPVSLAYDTGTSK